MLSEKIIRDALNLGPRMMRVAFKTRDGLIAFEDVEEEIVRHGRIERGAPRPFTSIRRRHDLQEAMEIRRYSFRGDSHEGCPLFKEESP